MLVATTGSQNVAIGDFALGGLTTTPGNNNTAIGFNAGTSVTFGGANVMIGANCGQTTTTGNNNIFIGNSAGSNTAAGTSNVCVIGSDSAAATDVLFGKGDLSATPTTYTIHGTDGLGAHKVSGQLKLPGGRPHGAGTGARLGLP